ncbi:MAG TPA: FAD-binding oxidoreductase [Acidimicrobiales bacterium]|nr:FAD-binding oxidoreductase [Acidimicrobiales bacterium]
MADAPGPADVVRALGAVVGRAHVVTDPDVLAGAVVDWTGRVRGHTPALVRPADTEELAAVVRWCAGAGVGLTVQGGNTGLSGGAVPRGQVVVQTTRLSEVGDVDALAGQVTVGAGVTLARLQQAATDAGWAYAVDFASRQSATVGGTVATNAGGVHVVRYGATRAQLLGVEAVLGAGAVVARLGGLVKDVSGYDLAALLCGSEGTLGIVTRARLRLVAPEPWRTTAIVGFPSVRAAVDAASELRRRLPSLVAAELMLDQGVSLVCRALDLAPPFDRIPPAVLLLEAAGPDDVSDALAGALAALGPVGAAAVATDASRRAPLWRYRDGHSEAIASLGVPHKLDVAVPLGAVADYLEAVPAAVRTVAPDAQVWLFGHIGDGNVHVNVTGVAPDDERVDEAVLELALELGGTISAEHGVGTVKRRFLERARPAAELDAFRALKRALDPAGILNPGVLLPD